MISKADNLPKVLLFDLGGVIVPSIGMEVLAEYNDITRAEVSDRFDASEVYRAFERGRASEADFIAELPHMFDLPDGDIIELWNSWVLPPYPGTLEALATLKQNFTVACLSNTNSTHWAHLNRMFDLEATFEFAFASQNIHEAKPDAMSYKKPLKIMGVAPEDVWFFEDTAANIRAARAVGITTFEVDRAVGVLPQLRTLNLIA